MGEYISREAFKARIREQQKKCASPDDIAAFTVFSFLLQAVDEEPAADVQPVVHCKDCKYRKERHYEESGEKPYIKYECKFTKYSMSDDGFCSFGAKRNDIDNG